MSEATKILFFCVIALLFISTSTSYLILEKYGIQVSGINVPTGLDSFSSKQNYINNAVDEDINFQTYGSYWQYIENVGRVLITKDFQRYYSWLLLDKIQPDTNGEIVNIYNINNTVESEYAIVLRYTNGIDQNMIMVLPSGFKIPNIAIPSLSGGVIIGYQYEYSYPNADKVHDVTIKTVYNDKQNTVDFYFNDNENKLFTAPNLKGDLNLLGLFGRYYGGIGATKEGFVYKSFETTNTVINLDSTNPLIQVAAFIVTMGKLIVWNIEETYLPNLVNVFLIKPFAIGIIICLIVIWRG